jgi:hypothetical protein
MALSVNLALTWALVGLIWTIQVVQYPGFADVGTAELARFHAAHSTRITFVVLPLMAAEVAAAAWLCAAIEPSRRWVALAAAALVGVAWLSTAVLQVPLHGAIAEAAGRASAAPAALVERLVATNWVRTAAWTARGALLLWAVAQR